jgi:hypothetical protein
MRLPQPFIISSRLMPALKIGTSTLSLEISGETTRDGRDVYTVYLDLDNGQEYEITDLKSGCQGGDVLEGFRALLSFLGAAVESRRYRESTEREGENEDLFSPAIVDWASDNSMYLECAESDLEPLTIADFDE